jgi:N-methylhydantoinase B
VLDVIQGKVTVGAARADYGVVLRPGPDGWWEADLADTARLRAQLRAARGPLPFFDRGPGYRRLSGREQAELDTV